MVHCIDFWNKWKKQPNFCGVGKTTATSYENYLLFVKDLSERYDIQPEIIYLNAPHGSVKELLRFNVNSPIREVAQEEIIKVLKNKRSITSAYCKKILGLEPKTRISKSLKYNYIPPIETNNLENKLIKDRIRLITNALSTPQLKILIAIMEKENLDNEYDALLKSLQWSKERLNENKN